ncbi:MAG: cation:proton antiporter [Bacteroidia bacterium]
MEGLNIDTYTLLIAASVIIILSFLFGELSRKTNIPSVLMLIVLGILIQLGLETQGVIVVEMDLLPILRTVGTVGLIMIVLEAALELELKREKVVPIIKALLVALLGLAASAYAAVLILQAFLPDMDNLTAWLYATPISILSSAIIIPSVGSLGESKREFHIYESTFSDILGIMLFYFLSGLVDTGDGSHSASVGDFSVNVLITLALSFLVSYLLVLVFQKIKSHVKLFLLIAVLLLLYAVGKKFHLSSLIIILIFGLLISNMSVFFQGRLRRFLDLKKAEEIYENLHVVTMETAFVVRTFFFVIFGLTIVLSSLVDLNVALISGAIILSIYAIRFVLLRIFLGKDILPQLFIVPRGLVTVLLFYDIPDAVHTDSFNPGILLFVIIVSSLIMTFAMIWDKRRTGQAVRQAQGNPVGVAPWKAPTIQETDAESNSH